MKMWNAIKDPTNWLGLGQSIFGVVIGANTPPDINSPTFMGAVVIVITGVVGIFLPNKKKG